MFESTQAVALSDVRAARNRMPAVGRLAAVGRDPVGGGWHGGTPGNAAHITRRGPLTGTMRAEHGAWDTIQEIGGIGRLTSQFFLTPHHAVACVVLLRCQTGSDAEAASGLSANCLVNPAYGYASVAYVKLTVGPGSVIRPQSQTIELLIAR